MYKFSCPFQVRQSHEIHEIGFLGKNSVKFVLPKEGIFINFLGINVYVGFFIDGKYLFEITDKKLDTNKKQVEYLEKLSEYISFLLNRKEVNPHYGNCIIDIEWVRFTSFELKEEKSGDLIYERANMFSSSSATTSWELPLADACGMGFEYHDIFRYYFDGLQAGHPRSKFFHWFLILEYLEKTKKYKNLFDSDKLFDEHESTKLKEIADSVKSPLKKEAILSLLKKTKDTRKYKMLTILNEIGVHEAKFAGSSTELTEELLKTIIEGRNSLFHSGTKYPKQALWTLLFPIVTQIVERVSLAPGCLD